jgi:hypothetical protein
LKQINMLIVIGLLVFSHALQAEITLSRELVMDISRTWGYVLGQQARLDEISQKHPSLKGNVYMAEKEFELAFGSSINAIDSRMKKYAKDFWFKVTQQIKEQNRDLIRNNPSNSNSANDFISMVTERSKGVGIDSPIYETLLMFKPGYQKYPIREFNDRHRYHFKSDGSGKAKGVKFHIQIPTSWKSKEAERPNIVRKFVSENGRGPATIMVLVLKAVEPHEAHLLEQDMVDIVESKRYHEFVPEGFTLIDGGKLTLEDLPGAWYTMNATIERMRSSVELESINYAVVYKNLMIQIQGQVATKINGEPTNNGGLKKYLPLFDQVVNSLVLRENYL